MNQTLLRKILYITIDAIGIVCCIIFSVLIKFGFNPPRDNLQLILDFFYLIIGLHLVVYMMSGLYTLRKYSSLVDIAYKNFWVETLAILLLVIFFLIVRTYGFLNIYRPDLNASRGLMINIWLFCLVYITLWRWVWMLVKWHKSGLDTPIVIIGSPNETGNLTKSLETYSTFGHKVMGCINPYTASPGNEENLSLENLEAFARSHQIQEIIIAANIPPNQLLEVIDICQRTACTLWIYPSLYEVMNGRKQIQEIGGIPLIELNPIPLEGLYRGFKRLLDIIVSLLGLIITSPLFVLIPIVVKLDSIGPVFYSQKRLGKDGKLFSLYKFRTMEHNAERESGPILAADNDPRITRVGRFLRQTRIDEIPQLISVLRGDMSLVGPRPERPELMTQFSQNTPFFNKRLAIRPGVTGLAQIQGRYDLDTESKLRYDLAYIYNANLLLDLKILLDTIKVVFTARGAR